MGLALETVGWTEAPSPSCKAPLKAPVLLGPLVLFCPLCHVFGQEDRMFEGTRLWRKQREGVGFGKKQGGGFIFSDGKEVGVFPR